MSRPDDDHWLSRPTTVRKLWWAFAVLLALTVLVQIVFPVDGHFGADGWFGFAAVFGFGACVIMVFFAKALGMLLKRPDDYYDD
ncbi:MAG: hypothetical protein RIB46_07220 [Pseudomonadales bacterium]